MDIKILTPDEAQLTASAERQLALAKAYRITSNELYTVAADDLKAIKSRINELDVERKKITKPLDDAKAAVMSLFRRPVEALQEAERIIKTSMLAFDNEQERIRKQEQDRLLEIQRAAAQKAEAEAKEARRIAAEATAAAANAKTEDDRKAAEARLAEAGALEEAAATQQAALAVAPAPIVAMNTAKVAGIARKTTWRGECFDKLALVKAVAEGKAPITLLDVNDSALNQMARAMKETLSYPGCRALEEKGIASSRG
jgi:uncharacterized protein (UPF0335 family)